MQARIVALLIGCTAWTGAAEVPLLLNNYAGAPPEAIALARAVTARAFEGAEVKVSWEQPGEKERTVRPVTIHLLPDHMARRMQDRPCAKTVAEAATIWVEWSCVERMAPSGHAKRVGQVLGYLIAHEVGHVLLADHRHDEGGLMRASWSAREQADLDRGELRFADPARLRDSSLRWVRNAGVSVPVREGSAK